MLVASIEIERLGEKSAILSATTMEEVRDIANIEWTPTHVVFNLTDSTTVAYRADRVLCMTTYNEE